MFLTNARKTSNTWIPLKLFTSVSAESRLLPIFRSWQLPHLHSRLKFVENCIAWCCGCVLVASTGLRFDVGCCLLVVGCWLLLACCGWSSLLASSVLRRDSRPHFDDLEREQQSESDVAAFVVQLLGFRTIWCCNCICVYVCVCVGWKRRGGAACERLIVYFRFKWPVVVLVATVATRRCRCLFAVCWCSLQLSWRN